ncbi:MAG: cadherin-like beta sandwich domain-containing protein [Luteolibacter sp.]|uniref:RCC1 domain-containing protein n=1 Tax=Luteolibacter sp. TaxID=1962973 RepID=UPI0032668C15
MEPSWSAFGRFCRPFAAIFFLLTCLLATVGSAPGAVVPADFTSASSIPVKAGRYVAEGNRLKLSLGFAPEVGTHLTVVRVVNAGPITGEFTNLKQGQRVRLEFGGITYKFVANYRGGNGNDLVLDWAYQNIYSWGSNDSGQLTGDRNSWSEEAWTPDKASLSGKTVSRIAAGESHSVALLADGSVVAWGDNTYGQLGDGTNTSSSVPVVVDTAGVLAGKTVIDVAAGAAHSLALCLDGTVVCWGRNQGGQLGDTTYTDRNVPVALYISGPLYGRTITAIAAGAAHSLAIRSDGKIVEWGNYYPDTIVDGQTSLSIRPRAVLRTGALAGKTAVAVAAGKSHSIALCSDNTLVAWGDNSSGQLGIGAGFDFSDEPLQVPNEGVLAGRKIMALAAGSGHNLVLLSDGKVAGWGSNYTGQLGIDSTLDSWVPVEVNTAGALSGKKVVAVAAGSFHSLAVCSDGTLAAWGYNGRGQFGNGTLDTSFVPVAMGSMGDLSGKKVVHLAAGGGHSLALAAAPLSDDSSLASLGLDVPAVDYSFSPGITDYVASVPKGTSAVSLAPVARRPPERIFVNGSEVKSGSASLPISLAEGETLIAVKVTAEDGTFTTYSITVLRPRDVSMAFQRAADTAVSARAYDATGLNADISLTFAPPNGTSLTMVDNTGLNFITGEFSNLAQGQVVSLGYQGLIYKFVVNYHGGTGNDLVLEWYRRRVVSWGINSSGELGNGNKTLNKLPQAVTDTGILAGKVVLTVVAGSSHNLALCSDGTLAAWGGNSSGQLGDGGSTSQPLAVEVDRSGVLAGKQVVAIAAGSGHSLALCSDGTLAAWGAGGNGRLGNGDVSDSHLPVAVDQTGALAGKRVVAISAGYDFSVALCSDGTVMTWGNNQYGQTGGNSGEDRMVPSSIDQKGILSGRIVTAVSSGLYHNLVLCSDGTLATWGWNYSGQLGDGTQTDSRIPVPVDQTGILSGRKIVFVDAGGSQSLCLCSDGTLAAWGSNGSGQLGNGGSSNSNIPVAVTKTVIFSDKSISRISTGNSHSLASCTDGTVVAWGLNSSGQLGDGSTISRKTPVAVDRTGFLSDKNVVAMSAGNSHSVAIATESPSSGLSGLTLSPGTLSPVFSPEALGYTAVVAARSSFTVTPVTRDASAAVKVNGVSVASGSPSGPIPVSPGGSIEVVVTAESAATTTYVIAMPTGVAAVFTSSPVVPVTSTGYNATGWSADLALGFSPPVGTNLTVINNVGIGFITGQFTNLAQGQAVDLSYNGKAYHFVANYYGGTGNDLVLEWANRSVAAWGSDASGQLGNDSTTNSPVPVAVVGTGALSGKTVMAVSGGASHSLALCSDGTVVSWGSGQSGQLGGDSVTVSRVPVAVKNDGALSGKTVVSITSSNGSNLALCSDGTVAAWGYGGFGQLGNGTNINAFVPVAVTHTGVLAGRSVVAVSVGGTHALALCSDGRVVSWGKNTYGQLGNGTTTDSNLPVLVSNTGVLAGKSVVGVCSGYEYSMALCSDGTMVGWGPNVGNLLDTFESPVKVPAAVKRTGALVGKTVTALSQGGHSTVVALCSDGKVVTWGLNDLGQLGAGTAVGSLPVAVSTSGVLAGKSVVHVSSGFAHTVAACSDGTVVTWGFNAYGQLGNDTTVNSSVPVAVSNAGVLGGKKALNGGAAFHSLLVVAEPDPVTIGPAFASASLPETTGSSDPDHDGIPNLMEYVLHGDPNSPSTEILPRMTIEGDHFVFRFHRLTASGNDTNQVFQYSADMIHWSEVDISSVSGVLLGATDANGCQPVTVTVPKGEYANLFGRLRVSKP